MRVIIVSLASQYVHSTLAPWYLFYSARALCKGDVSVKVLEGTVNEGFEDLYKKISEENADLIAFSCYIWNIKLVKLLAEELHKTGVEILLGGPEVSYNASELLREKYVDYVISGEGEEPFSNFLNARCKGEDLSKISGLCYKNNNKIIQ